jgi:hypothetical protein
MNETIKTAAPAPVAVGDIFRNSWGYDQTNVDYYQVVRVTAKSVSVRPICQKRVEDTGSSNGMACRVRPVPDSFTNAPAETRRFKLCGDNYYITSKFGCCARVSPTESAYCSWYA